LVQPFPDVEPNRWVGKSAPGHLKKKSYPDMSKKTLQAHLDDYFKAAVIIYISLQGTMTI
jgi:hypothetical protein